MSGNRNVGIPCQVALDELKRTSANVRRFWNLIYAVGAATAVGAVYAIVLFAVGQTAAGIISGIASVLGGGGTAFLNRAKDDAFDELREAKQAVTFDCSPRAGGRGLEESGPQEAK